MDDLYYQLGVKEILLFSVIGNKALLLIFELHEKYAMVIYLFISICAFLCIDGRAGEALCG